MNERKEILLDKAFGFGSLFCFLIVGVLLVYVIGWVPIAQSATKAPVMQEHSGFDYKFILQVLIVIGSLLGYAFYNGSKLGRIEEKLLHIETNNNNQSTLCSQCLRDNREARKEIWQEINSTKERVVRIETQLHG